MTEHITLLQQENLWLQSDLDPEELAHFIEGAAEACCRGLASEPTHRVAALSDAEEPICLPAGRSFDRPTQDDELLP